MVRFDGQRTEYAEVGCLERLEVSNSWLYRASGPNFWIGLDHYPIAAFEEPFTSCRL